MKKITTSKEKRRNKKTFGRKKDRKIDRRIRIGDIVVRILIWIFKD